MAVAIAALVVATATAMVPAGALDAQHAAVALVATPDGTSGYGVVNSVGARFDFGTQFTGTINGYAHQPVVAAVDTADGRGTWWLASDGGVFATGTAQFHGSAAGLLGGDRAVALVTTPDRLSGYAVITASGARFDFGTQFTGTINGYAHQPVVAAVDTADGRGTWWLASDGGVFATGTAQFHGSAAAYDNNAAPDGTTPSTARDLAQKILANPHITANGRLVLSDLQSAADGRVSSAGAYLKASILRVIYTLGRDHTVWISALESGGSGHTQGSLHYAGAAVDISNVDGIQLTGRNAPAITAINISAPLLPSGSGFGQSNCGQTPPLPPGITTFTDTCNHLHIQVPRNAS